MTELELLEHIDRIAGNGWRVPHDINPGEYKPEPVQSAFYEGGA